MVTTQASHDVTPTRVPPTKSASPPGAAWRSYAAVLATLDAVAMLTAAVVAEAIRSGSLGQASAESGGVPYLLVGVVLAAAWLGILALGGAYDRSHLGSGSEEYRRVFSSAARLLSIVAIVALVLELDIARTFVAVMIPLGTALTVAQRHVVRRWLHRQRARGRFLRQVLIVGAAHTAQTLAREVKKVSYTGLSVSAVCLADQSEGFLDVDGEQLPVLGPTDELLEIVRASGADAVLVADRTTLSVEMLRQLAWQVEGTGVTLYVTPEVTDVAGPLVAIRPVSGLPILTVEEPELSGARRLLKEAFDRISAAAALVLLLPVLLLIWVTVRLTSPGPAVFKQVRVGLRGRRFVLWKFRTMTVDAEERLATLYERNEHDGVMFKIRDDPRITPLGRLLRRWSLDELPQLWNVARGEMSIVGPRPPLPSEVENYCERVRRRLLVKPGMTGLWQISGRSGLPWEEAVRLDLHYVENWSPSLDIAILAKTVSAVLRRRGAY